MDKQEIIKRIINKISLSLINLDEEKYMVILEPDDYQCHINNSLAINITKEEYESFKNNDNEINQNDKELKEYIKNTISYCSSQKDCDKCKLEKYSYELKDIVKNIPIECALSSIYLQIKNGGKNEI